jgi:hypothetical protein
MFNTITTAVALAVTLTSPSATTGTPPAPPAHFDVADVEVSTGNRSAHWATFDADGDQSGEVVIWADADNQIRLDANFADGRYFSGRVDGEGHMVGLESDDVTETVERVTKIRDFLYLDPPSETAGRELLCMASVVVAATCIGGSVAGCVVGGAGIVCNCMPLWEKGYEPPGCGYD